jgi:hypothetical protein
MSRDIRFVERARVNDGFDREVAQRSTNQSAIGDRADNVGRRRRHWVDPDDDVLVTLETRHECLPEPAR